MRTTTWLETFSPSACKLFKSKESFKKWAEEPRVVGGRFPGRLGHRSSTSGIGTHSRGEKRAPPARPLRIQARLAPHPHGQKSLAIRGRTPRPAPAALLGPHSQPCPAGDLRDCRRERLLRRGADQQRLEKCQSQGQQAASSHLRDRRSIPPPSPAGGRNGARNRGRRRRIARCPDRRRLEGWRARGPGRRLARGATGGTAARGRGGGGRTH